MVKRDGLVDKLVVTADGSGQVGHAGSSLLAGVADRVGLTGALSAAMAPTRQRRSEHDPGVVVRDLAVMLADGGECLADLGAVRDQLGLFGNVASDSTAFRVIDSIDQEGLDRLRGAVALARARAWQLGARPGRSGDQGRADDQARAERTVLDVDATLTGACSEKELAAGNFKGGYGHHPLLCYLDETGEAPAGILRPGNAGSNTASDHVAVLDLALAQLDPQALEGEILVRGDGAGATHELTEYCREGAMGFSFGFDLSERVREAIPSMSESAWVKAIRSDGTERERSQVCEITGQVDLSAWPQGSRLIARRTKLKEGDQQSFADHDGYRFAVFLTDQPDQNIAALDLTHRQHARVEGSHPREQGLRAFQPAVQILSAKQGVAVARAARPGSDRLDQAAVPRRRRARLGTQTAALPPASPIRTDRPPRPPNDPAPRPRLGLGPSRSPPRSRAYKRYRIPPD